MKKILIAALCAFLCPSFSFAQSLVWTVAGTGATPYSGDGMPATSSNLFATEGVWLDGANNVYISDMGNHRIRKVSAATGIISTIAGTGTPGYSGDEGPAIAANIKNPYGLYADYAGNCYFADLANNRIRKIDAATGLITTLAGTGAATSAGDGGPATAAAVNAPRNVYVDELTGAIYIAGDARIRKIAGGIITTVAGTGTAGLSGDGGPATAAQLSVGVAGIIVTPGGDLFFADRGNSRIRKISAATGIVSTVAGSTPGFSGDGGPATAAQINSPIGLAVDAAGNIIIADNHNNRVRWVDASTGIISTVGGGGPAPATAEGTPALSAFMHPEFLCLKSDCASGELYFSNWMANNQVRKITGFAPSAGSGAGMVICTGSTLPASAPVPGGTWSTGSSAVIAVSATGAVSGIAPGTGVVSYVLPSGCTTLIVVTVTPLPSLVAGTVCSGAVTTLPGASGPGYWASSMPAVATVSPVSGVISGLSPGTSTISFVSAGGCASAAIITVTDGPLVSSVSVCTGATIPSPGAGGVWTTSAPGIAAVSASGLISGLAPGTAIISHIPGGSACVSIMNVTVMPATDVSGFDITGICAGNTMTLPLAHPDGHWSSASSFITIAPPATVIAMAPGTALITYNVPGVCSGVTTLNVFAAPGAITGLSSVFTASTISLANATPGGLWSSSNAAVASVDAAGNVTGIAPGTSTIYYSLPMGCYTSVVVTVFDGPVMLNPPTRIVWPVSLFPNPATDELTITTGQNVFSSLTITNAVGQQMLQQDMLQAVVKVSVKQLPAGVYYVTLRGAQGSEVRKFVKW